MTKIIISNNSDNLRTTLNNTISATVEAEFGDVVIEGSVLTLAHHGSRSNRPCPCIIKNLTDLGIEVIGVSHIDLDTLGGVRAILGEKSEFYGECKFWEIAAKVDVRGIHKLNEIFLEVIGSFNPNNSFQRWLHDCLNAFWAFSESFRIFPDRDGSVTEITDAVEKFSEVLDELLLAEDSSQWRKHLIHQGKKWAASKEQLKEDSFVDETGGVVVRRSTTFVNHLYTADSSIVVGFNTKTGSITISAADDGIINACELVQAFFPDKNDDGEFLAGGHAGIAGSPRGKVFTLIDAIVFAEFVRNKI